MIPSDCLLGTWRLTKENLAPVFQQSLRFVFLPHTAEIYTNESLYLGGGAIWEAEEEERGPERVTEGTSMIEILDIHS